MFGNGKGNEFQERAEQIQSDVADNLRDLSRNARGTADEVKKEAVKLLHAAADTIRREARERATSKDVRSSADDVARGLEHAAHYLKRNSFEDMGEDVEKSVKSNPWRTMAIIFVVGIVVGIMLRGDGQDDRARGW